MRLKTQLAFLVLASFCFMCSHVDRKSSLRNVVMDGGTWRSGKIPVCWEQDLYSKELDNERQLIRTTIESQYNERTVSIRFHGWEICGEGFPGLRVGVDNTKHSRVKAIGGSIAGIKNGLTFNFDAINQRFSGASRANLLKFVAVHEFGHAIGLMHEIDHPDSVPCVDTPKITPGTPGSIPFREYDSSSVMNYCTFGVNIRDQNLEEFWKLSSGDVETIDAYYQHKIEESASKLCIAAGGIWSTMTRAPGCCFNLRYPDTVSDDFVFCGSSTYINSPLTGTRDEIFEDLDILCRQRNSHLNREIMACQKE